MTYYYSKNSNFAPNIIFDPNLLEIFNEEEILTSLLTYKEDVIDSSTPLFGGEGTRLQLAKLGNNTPLFLTDINATVQAMKDGLLSYRQTPLGGCSRTGSCDKIAFLSVTACISCRDSIFSSRSIDALKLVKTRLLKQFSQLEPDREYSKQLSMEIESIDKILNKLENTIEVSNVN